MDLPPEDESGPTIDAQQQCVSMAHVSSQRQPAKYLGLTSVPQDDVAEPSDGDMILKLDISPNRGCPKLFRPVWS